jgi:endonuclease YncB( thermonuclease family)
MEFSLLKRSHYDSLLPHTLNGLCLPAKIHDVYDGDTPWVVFYRGGIPQLHRFRMAGYNSPERTPRLITPNRDLHKQAAMVARAKLARMVAYYAPSSVVWLHFSREDKYGRPLGDMFIPDLMEPEKWHGTEVSVNRWMVANEYGKPYFGGAKTPWTEHELQRIVDKEYDAIEGLVPGTVSASDASVSAALDDADEKGGD